MLTKNSLKNYKPIATFLVFELLALVSFLFGEFTSILYILGAVTSIIGFVFAFVFSETRKDFIKLVPVLAILFIVSFFEAFGPFGKLFDDFGPENISVLFALPSFFSFGFCIRRLTDIKIKHVFLILGLCVALLTLVSLIATWISYGFFYALIYRIKDTTLYYYNGSAFDITKEMYFFIGFQFIEVSVSYGGLFAIICGSFLSALLFLKPRENKIEFILYSAIGGIGILTLITIPYFKGLIVLSIVYLFALAYRFLFSNNKFHKPLVITIGSIIGLGLLFYILIIFNAAIGFKFPGILNRIFVDNGKMENATSVLELAFAKNYLGKQINIFGFNMFESFEDMSTQSDVLKTNIGYFEIEIIKEVGPIISILFLAFLGTMVYFLYKYLKENNDRDNIKIIILSMVVGFFMYLSLFNTITPYVHDSSYYCAFFRSSPLMLIMIILGLVYYAPCAKEVVIDE